ncbi:hypothetical protein LK12_10635 [Novosphingobium malaysiense]|uniref:Uncharacterized protein n=2 Tax=Novosphingobium malaysiense TaxID=1348853 RepID=A0A0B1ZLG5_9SPHN|nr:hypothetical protein LK12_10635 [Novosphingobium malaysiense]
MKFWALAVPVTLMGAMLNACQKKDPERKAQQDAHDVAMVERMSRAPFKPIVPSPITADVRERYGLDRAACAFRKKDGRGPLFLAGSREGFLNIAGDIKRYAAKAETAVLPGHARTTYIGLSGWADLVRLPDQGTGADQKRWPARLILHDAQERIAYTADGTVTCKG